MLTSGAERSLRFCRIPVRTSVQPTSGSVDGKLRHGTSRSVRRIWKGTQAQEEPGLAAPSNVQRDSRLRQGARPRSRRNGTVARVAVMQRGSGGGKFFEGYEPASRERPLCWKRDEPQDRHRDATSPKLVKRRKPPRWCKTTRAERAKQMVSVLPKQRSKDSSREWTLTSLSDGGECRRRVSPLSLHRGIGIDPPDESQGSQARHGPGETGALNESQDHEGRFRSLRKEIRNCASARTPNVSW